MIFSCQVSENKSSGGKDNTYGYFFEHQTRKKAQLLHESQCHRAKEFAALCMLRCVFAATRKKGHGETTILLLGKGEFPSEHHSIPFSPYFHVCVPIWFFHYARVASRVIVKMNQEPLLLLCCPLLLFLYRL